MKRVNLKTAVACLCTLVMLGGAVAGAAPTDAQATLDKVKSSTWPDPPRYVFYFIGDGMASPQIHATEAFLAARQAADEELGSLKAVRLFMSEMPVQGAQMSFANNRFITGSAAAGTALACGVKTSIGVISMNDDASEPYTTLAELAKQSGMKVGIVSSVSIDHATPAVFYAHQPSRNNYEEIGAELLASSFDYFAGGGFRVNKYTSEQYQSLSNEERYQIVEQTAVANGFTFSNTRAEFDALHGDDIRAIAVNPHLDGSNAMPYAINRKRASAPGETYEGSITLAEFTQKGIDLLSDNEAGFFMMIEGGKIDWACHANDARAAIEDTLAFDDAVNVAIAFAKRHPADTLIVVTGDHECGGMTLGFAGTAYETYYEMIERQTIAYDDFQSTILTSYATAKLEQAGRLDREMEEIVAGRFRTEGDGQDQDEVDSLTARQKTHLAHAFSKAVPGDIDDAMWQIIYDSFGMDGNGLSADEADDLTEYEIHQLEDAFDLTFHGTSDNFEQEDDILYGYYDPLTVSLTHIHNRRAGMSWTSYSHTAVPVPVLAMGVRAGTFVGYYDNTAVAKRLARVMELDLDN